MRSGGFSSTNDISDESVRRCIEELQRQSVDLAQRVMGDGKQMTVTALSKATWNGSRLALFGHRIQLPPGAVVSGESELLSVDLVMEGAD